LSLRKDVEEFAKWITELTAKKEPSPTPGMLFREDWQGIEDNLRVAATKYSEARSELRHEKPTFLAELAADLEAQAEALKRRANLLSRRASPKPEEPKPPPQPKPDDEDAPARSRIRSERKRSAVDLLKSAQGTVETAHRKLGVKNPDAVVKGFEGELDVLAEMTLNLRAHCESADDDDRDEEG
jgi:hypothetical protein